MVCLLKDMYMVASSSCVGGRCLPPANNLQGQAKTAGMTKRQISSYVIPASFWLESIFSFSAIVREMPANCQQA
jgi:hypothetical protein